MSNDQTMSSKHSNSFHSIHMQASLLVFMLLLLGGCVEPFAPPEIASAERYLVIDGFLNTGLESSQIQLKRTQNVSDTSAPAAELKAQVTVEGDLGSHYVFTEEANGVYRLGAQQLNENEQFRLRIITANGKEYLSAFVPVIRTPLIDSVRSVVDRQQGGAQFYVTTHDPLNKTRFYRWKYEETWEFRTPFYSNLEVTRDTILWRTEDISTCWQTELSTNILVGSSIHLSQDIIQDFPITFAASSTDKLLYKYSILVKQFGLSQDGFEYWTRLAKTTQNTGGIFDPLPSQVTGNIQCMSNPKELVFGYFSASSVSEKRIFLTASMGQYPYCELGDTLTYLEALIAPDLIISPYYPPNNPVPLYVMAPTACADCRLHGGINVKPAFWP